MQQELRIISKQKIARDTVEMVLENESISQVTVPGQFLHIHVQGHMLRRPISIANVDASKNTITILFKILGEGTRKLSMYDVGDKIDVLGPNGNGFLLDNTTQASILLVGGGIGVPPLYYLAKKLTEQGTVVTAILGFQSKEHVFYEEKFRELGNTIVVTNDGTYGEKGYVTNVSDEMLPIIDRYYSCGPLPMLKAVKERWSTIPGYLSLEERMGCGIGACFACVIPTDDRGGYKKICQDGPVFTAEEVHLG
ncbi:dihydroorotate dehydrogenase electron transfer subunit [Virgibacillus pantothenticus]|uniref:Dihydroorotate dehydrogenase B (NAD(+)), electron transfer subunit n=1 Tax=Virgibacillus pantothenticus TaxID=1473 RepID=A0A0L0QNB1_VIRPA|nr:MULTISPECIES: dihydroorotate dehydrogenase electron transfer subunit [Virgibacillus]API93820.1 dihydroorotate dehydrogenase electron transfer subunit [Virgibacillus sp. 6R]KNE20105.1 dihydroorotate dehydrogenase [Virgibacillus pantothenticus]MBS7427636.1 dihydroorotate dehydrogenase electron transfer subunit [Virgibacillus sp. 19R1-5]MBU8565873.1 dihydroorotate dehydrogenase electron transfer subunit [Virgibacillus pantothenticus]MBU8601090.1 dihydroorotate dehydrogenase electron transfer s